QGWVVGIELVRGCRGRLTLALTIDPRRLEPVSLARRQVRQDDLARGDVVLVGQRDFLALGIARRRPRRGARVAGPALHEHLLDLVARVDHLDGYWDADLVPRGVERQ